MAHHVELSLDDRITIRDHHLNGLGCRAIGRLMKRSCGTISLELRRSLDQSVEYTVQAAHAQAMERRRKPRVIRKLSDETLWGTVRGKILLGLSPEQIAGQLRFREGGKGKACVSHETIYKAIYLIPRGSLRKELIGCLRQRHRARKPRTRNKDQRGKIPDMQSIHIRPPDVESRLVPGHWEGDLIKGARNGSSIGTLVERASGFVVLAKMSSASAADTLESFVRALETIPPALRKTLTYDQGREMSYHAALTLRTGVQVFFADPHSPWQRGSNENTNGLLRQYLPKGMNLADYSQKDLDLIAYSLNTRPRRRFKFQTPLDLNTLDLYLHMIHLEKMDGLAVQ